MRIIVVGGGTATNAIAPVFPSLAFHIEYVVPISDNGGSTSEVLRVFGGPAIGDARSRLVRLMDPQSPVRSLLSLRLSDSPETARQEWNQIVEGTHGAWSEIAPYMKAMYRAFLVDVHAQLLKKTTRSTKEPFNFSRASIGNLMITGARLYFGTLEAAIEFVLHTTRIHSQYSVVPCLESNFTHHIAAKLRNGQVIIGQSAISHPAAENLVQVGEINGNDTIDSIDFSSDSEDEPGEEGSSILPFSHPSLRTPQIMFAKDSVEQLPSPIKHVYYVNMYGDEIRPKLSTRVVTGLQTADSVIFSVGSLFTSIIPVLLLKGFASSLPRLRVLILNGSEDRETKGMSLLDQVQAINQALDYSLDKRSRKRLAASSHTDIDGHTQYLTGIVHPRNVNASELLALKIKVVPADCIDGEYVLPALELALKECLDETGPSLVRVGDL